MPLNSTALTQWKEMTKKTKKKRKHIAKGNVRIRKRNTTESEGWSTCRGALRKLQERNH